MKQAIIIEAEQYEADQKWRAKIESKMAIYDTVLRHMNYVPLREAMKMTGLKSTKGIHAAAARGELECRYKSEKKPEFSMASIIDYLERKGCNVQELKHSL